MYILAMGLLLIGVVVFGLEKGDKCTTTKGENGICKGVRQCEPAIKEIIMMKKPPVCSFINELVVCCVEPEEMSTTTIRSRYMFTTPKQPFRHKEKCDPISNNITVPMRKSLQKCLEYQESLVYPCQESLTPNGGMVRDNRCNWKPEELIIGGINSYLGEFPHMVHLGYGRRIIEWKCAGTIVSERFVLTAGHCTYSKNSGAVTKIRIAFLKKSEEITEMKLYNVKEIYKHRNYMPPLSYNDIALLETDRPMHLNRYAVPACLHDGSPINDTEIVATGWGTTESRMSILPDTLQKVVLERFSDEECRLIYKDRQIRTMPDGYDKNTQLCYGHRNISRDSCQGDSGGPVQIKHPDVKCMFLITGVISNGKWCGVPGKPGFNSRVASYIDWIESVVWPE